MARMEMSPDRRPEVPAPLRELNERTRALSRRAEELQEEIARIQETVISDDRRVSVTVGPGGIMQSIRVEAAGNSATATQLVGSVMKAYGKACRQAGERSAELVARLVPGSPVADLMRESIPPDPDAELDDGGRGR